MAEKRSDAGWCWPFGSLAEAMKSWESSLEEQGGKWLRDDRLLKSAGKSMAASMQAKAQWDRLMEQWMGGVRLATTGQMEEMARRLNDLDRRVDGISDRLEAILDRLDSNQKSPEVRGEGV